VTLCPVCTSAIDRNARLAVHVRKVTILVHAQGHHGGEWRQCADPICAATRRLLGEYDVTRATR